MRGGVEPAVQNSWNWMRPDSINSLYGQENRGPEEIVSDYCVKQPRLEPRTVTPGAQATVHQIS